MMRKASACEASKKTGSFIRLSACNGVSVRSRREQERLAEGASKLINCG